MAEGFEVKRGSKMDQDEARAAISSGKFALLIGKPPAKDVEGQYYYNGWTQCPYCGHIGWTTGLNSEVYETVICGACGMAFRA